jgi:hypothetical protein
MIFLVIILVIAVLLLAMVSQNPRGRRQRRSSHRGMGARGGGSSVARLSRDQVATRWITIEGMAKQGGGNGLRSAIAEADKLLDHVMRQQGAAGDTMADRLRSFNSRFSDRDSVWRAHKVRNSLAHDVGFDLVPSQARESLTAFERGIKDLGGM